MQQKAFFAVLIAATLAGSSGVFVKSIQFLPATSMSFIRLTLPTIVMAILMTIQRTPFFQGNYRLMLTASLFNAIRMYLFFVAYIYTSIGNAVIISYTWPIFTTLFSMAFLKEHVSRRNLYLMGVAFTGIFIVYINQPFSFGNRDFIGMSAALATAIFYAVTVVIFKKESGNYSRPEIIFYQNFLGGFIYLPFFLLHRPWPIVSDLAISMSHAIFLGILGFNFFFYGLRHLKASTASLIAYIEIVSALLFGVFWMNEPLTWNMLTGGALIVVSTMLLRK